ncbi:MAG: SpoIIE family protein phosphatase, partial [Oscillospiraceae bacterium]
TFFFLSSKRALTLGQSMGNFRQSDISSLFITGIIGLMALCNLSFGEISIGRIVCAILIVLAGCIYYEAGGAVAGIIVSLSVILSLGTDWYLIWVYTMGGLLSGAFARISKTCAAISFWVIGLAAALMVSVTALGISYTFNPLFDIAIGSIICLVLPKSFVEKIKHRVLKTQNSTNSTGIKSIMLSKLDDAQLALMDISKTTKEVSSKLQKINAGSISDVYNAVTENICNKCNNKHFCWQINYSATMDSFNNFSRPLKQKGYVENADVTFPIKGKCTRLDEIVKSVNYEYRDFIDNAKKLREVSKIREVVLDQFESLSSMLKGFSEEISEIASADTENQIRIENYFLSNNIEPLQINCFRDKNGRVIIDIFAEEYKLISLKSLDLKKDLGEICEVDFENPIFSVKDKVSKISLSEQSIYTVDFAWAQNSCKKEKVCGDSFCVFVDNKAKAYMVLSDGMGTGYNAAIDSAMTVSLIKKLIIAGVSYDATIRAANNALLVKTGDESLSTVDIASIDLFTGKTSFYKAGGAPSYVKKYDKTGSVPSTSLPIGILNKVSFEKSYTTLHSGDIVLMVSDGATGLDDQWIKKTLADFSGEDLNDLCEDIMVTAKLKRQKIQEDDITVLAARLKKA